MTPLPRSVVVPPGPGAGDGTDGGSPSVTVQLRDAGAPVPAALLARTAKVCTPASRPAYARGGTRRPRLGIERALVGRRRVAEVNTKDASVEAVVPAGPAVIDAKGGGVPAGGPASVSPRAPVSVCTLSAGTSTVKRPSASTATSAPDSKFALASV